PHLAARRPSGGALAKDAGQLRDREADRDRAAHHAHALDRLRIVDAVAVSLAVHRREDALLLVPADRVGAHPARASYAADAHPSIHAAHRRAWNGFQSQVTDRKQCGSLSAPGIE